MRWLLILLFLPVSGFAQNDFFKFRALTIDEGLSQNTVYDILQDQDGFMWFGTEGGLNRYDGHEFVIFKHDPTNENSLSHNVVNSMDEDAKGNLWVGTSGGGVCKINKETGDITRYLHRENDTLGLPNNNILVMEKNQQGILWVGTTSGLSFYDELTDHFYPITDKDGIIKNLKISGIWFHEDGNIWLGTRGEGIYVYTSAGELIKNTDFPPNASVYKIYEDRDGNGWIGTRNSGLFFYDKVENEFHQYIHEEKNEQSISGNSVFSILEDRNGVLWVGTLKDGLNAFDREKNIFHQYKAIKGNSSSLSDNSIWSLVQDASGLIWIGTYGGGVNMLNTPNIIFRYPEYQRFLNSPRVTSMACDKEDELWLGYTGGIAKLNKKEGYTPKFLIEDIDEEKVSVLLFDKLNNLWVGTWGNGLIKIINPGKENEKIVRYKNNPNDAESIKCDHIMALMEDDEGTIWVGTWEGGLEKIVRINGNISFKHYYRNDPHINDKTVIDIYQTKDKALWVGTTGNGLMRLHREMDLLQTWDEMGEYSMQLSSKYVNFIQEDPGGNLWVGTRNGLNKLDPLTGKISYYNEKNGFLNDNMISLAVDANHYYWITSEKGISRFNPLNGIVQNFSEIDGLSPIKFRAKARMNDGENVLFGGTYGFMYFNPTGFNAEYYIPQIAITHFDMKGGREKIGARKSLTYYSKEEYLEFNHDENILTFDFSVLSYRSPVKNHYAYILEGYDKEWIYMKDKRSVTYANLPSGEYTLKVKGAGYDGIWNEKGNSLGFVIKRPPWGTWWAYGIYVILVFVILVSYRKFIINREKLRTMLHLKKVEADQLNEINQLKSRFFSNVSHELKTPLTLIQSPIKVLKSGLTNSPEKMFEVIERNLGRLKKLIEQLLDLSKIESGVLQLSKENTDLLTLIREIIFQFEPYLQEKNVSLELITNNEHLIIHLDKEKTTEVITNLLDNAIKFSHEEGKITISVLTENENLMIKIRNTGMGVSEEDRKQIFNRYYQKDIPGMINSGVGIGLSLSKELVEMHGGTLDLESEYSKYAEFIISLPWKCLISMAEKNKETVELINTANPIERSKTVEADELVAVVIDDDRDIRVLLTQILESAGYQVKSAENGSKGYELIKNNMPDVIICDVLMPGLNGFELALKLKSDHRTDHIPLVLLTGKSDRESKLEGLRAKVNHYLTKPFDPEELLLKMENLIRERKKLMERLAPEKIPLSRGNTGSEFINSMVQFINENLDNPDLSVDALSEHLNMSRMQLYRKTKSLTGVSPVDYIRTYRLLQAEILLQTGKYSIQEVCFSVGFSSPSYFAESFRKYFNKLPSQVIKKVR